MNLRTLAVLGLAISLPAAAAAQEHKCACCAKGGHDAHATTPAPAAPPAASNVDPHASVAAPPYDVAYEGVFAGVIVSVMRHPGMDVQLTLGVGEKSFEVLVAPMPWLDAKRAVFRPGERVEILGSRYRPRHRRPARRTRALHGRSDHRRPGRRGTPALELIADHAGIFPIIRHTHRCALWTPVGFANIRMHSPATVSSPSSAHTCFSRGDSAPCCSQTRVMPAAAAWWTTSIPCSGGTTTGTSSDGSG